MKKIFTTTLVFICFSFFSQKVYGVVSICPKVFWSYATGVQCSDGNVNFGLMICPNDVAAPGVVFDHVDWNFGDGSPVLSSSSLSTTHFYSSNNTYQASATVYFTVDGVSCSTVALFRTSIIPYYYAEDYCSAPTNAYTTQNYVSVVVHNLNASLYLTPSGPYTPSTSITFKMDTWNIALGQVAPYVLKVDDVVVASGNATSSTTYTLTSNTFGEGTHVAELTIADRNTKDCSVVRTVVFEVLPAEKESCQECFTFKPEPGKRYWLSAWVKVDGSQVKTYTGVSVELTFNGSSPLTVTLVPSGDIIDNWQRIAGEFTPPSGATDVDIKLKNTSSNIAHFDDIRIHPFNASMKSYVNDPETFWLVAELDDNNYATFYEYDKEGKLIRIKKETERGVFPIKESRMANPKTDQ